MRYVGVRELKAQTSRILREVREEGEEFLVTYRGQVIARLVPVHPPQEQVEAMNRVWRELDALAAEIQARWSEDISAVEAVTEQRREL